MKANVIYGPPGTGKTRRLIEVLNNKATPGTMFVSHTRAAAFEAVNRFGANNTRGVDIQTLHSWCFKALSMSKAQTVDDAKLTEFTEAFGLDMSDDGEGRKYVDLMSFARAKQVSPIEAYHKYTSHPGTFAEFNTFVTSYAAWKAKFGYKDFSDMLEDGSKLKRSPRPIPMLFIDEAQDLSRLHWAVVDNIIRLNPNIEVIIAGDDDQALYSFAGADPHLMDDFGNRHGASVEVLGQSYRVPQKVHEVATQIIERVERRVPKQYAPTSEPGRVERAGGPYDIVITPGADSLILYGDRFTREEVEAGLLDMVVPYTALGGMPAPLDTKAGRALRLAEKFDGSQEAANHIVSCLNPKGKAIYDTIGIDAIVDKLHSRELSIVNVFWKHEEYLHAVDVKSEPKVRISTIHGAKGMEADEVHLVTAQSQAALREASINPDSQHRVYYVGATRARHNLFIYEGEQSYEI